MKGYYYNDEIVITNISSSPISLDIGLVSYYNEERW